MRIFDWLIGIFSPTTYDAYAALRWVKKTEKYRIIPPEERADFEIAFTNLVEAEMEKKERKLSKEEVNILVQRVRIRLSQKKGPAKTVEKYEILQREWQKFKQEILIILKELNNQKEILEINCDFTGNEKRRQNQLRRSKEEILRTVNKVMTKAKSKAGYFPKIDAILQKEIKIWIEMIHQIDARIERKISDTGFKAYISSQTDIKEDQETIKKMDHAKSA